MGPLAIAGWLAQDPPKPPQGPEFGGSSPIGLVVVLLLAVALILLIRSMNKHLRKVPKSFNGADEQRPDDAEAQASSDQPKESEESEDEPNVTKNGGGAPSSG